MSKRLIATATLLSIVACSPEPESKPVAVKLTALQKAMFNECVKAYPARQLGWQVAFGVHQKCAEAWAKIPNEARESAITKAMADAAQAYIDPAPGEVAKAADAEVDALMASKAVP